MKKNYSMALAAGLLMVACTGSGQAAQNEKDSTSCEQTVEEQEVKEFILADGKLGPISKGATASTFPKKVEGLYDKFEFESYENDMDDYVEEYYTFTQAGKPMFRANINEGKVFSITLLEGSSSIIKTSDGIYVGYSARELFKKKKLEWEFYFDTGLTGSDGKYTYAIDPDGYEPESTPEKATDLKANAKVCAITH